MELGGRAEQVLDVPNAWEGEIGIARDRRAEASRDM